MKKTYCILLLTLFTYFGSFAQKEGGSTKKLKEIWLSNESPGIKAMLVKGLNLKMEDLPLADAYAATCIMFQAQQNKEDGMRNLIQKFETLSPVTKKDLDDQYPKIVSAYEKFAQTKKLPIYHFQAELNKGLTLKELDKREDGKNITEPDFYVDRMRFYTIAMQRELYESRNIVILPTYKKIVDLWTSLNQTQKEALDQAGYLNYWKEQLALYNHKFTNKSWACLCGTTQSVFPNLPDCGKKAVPINEGEKNLDEAALVLTLFNKGDLSIIKETLRIPALATYTGSKDDIVRQLVFLHLSAINNWKMNSSMKISLVALWDKAEANGSNDYVRRIGLTREALVDLEAYYGCLLGIKSVAPTTEKDIAHIEKDSFDIPTPVIKETLVKQAPSEPTTFVQKLRTANITEMRNIWDHAIQNEITNRPNMFLCAETRVVNDSTLELDLKGCGEGKGTFKVMEIETPLVGEFFYYSTNVLSELLINYRKNVGGNYKLLITGTADTLRYRDNQGLADGRAKFVKANLGKKLLADCTEADIETQGLIDQDERKVTIRVTLYKPHS